MSTKPEFLLEYAATVTTADGKLGFRYSNNIIICLTPTGWAQGHGVKVDDRLLSVNGQDFSSLDEDAQFELLTGPRPLALKFGRPKLTSSYFEIECNDNSLGFMLNEDASIKSLVSNGWAEKNGLHLGDTIIECNGFVFSDLSEGAKISLLLKGPRPLYLLLSRPDDRIMEGIMSDEARKRESQKEMIAGENKRAAGGGGGIFSCCCGGETVAPQKI